MRLRLTSTPTEGIITRRTPFDPMPIDEAVKGVFVLSDTTRYVLRVNPDTGTRERFCKTSEVVEFKDGLY